MQEWRCAATSSLGTARSRPLARRHARNLLARVAHGRLADPAELLVSEIITNAVRATARFPIGGARPARRRVRYRCGCGSPPTCAAS